MINYEKEVQFDEYCHKCKYKDLNEKEDPCDDCLTWGFNQFSHKPIRFEEASK